MRFGQGLKLTVNIQAGMWCWGATHEAGGPEGMMKPCLLFLQDTPRSLIPKVTV